MTTTTTNRQIVRKVIVDEIRPQREALGLSREQLAVAAGCSLTMLGQIERGVVPRRGYVVDRVIRTLETL